MDQRIIVGKKSHGCIFAFKNAEDIVAWKDKDIIEHGGKVLSAQKLVDKVYEKGIVESVQIGITRFEWMKLGTLVNTI